MKCHRVFVNLAFALTGADIWSQNFFFPLGVPRPTPKYSHGLAIRCIHTGFCKSCLVTFIFLAEPCPSVCAVDFVNCLPAKVTNTLPLGALLKYRTAEVQSLFSLVSYFGARFARVACMLYCTKSWLCLYTTNLLYLDRWHFRNLSRASKDFCV